MPDLGDDHPALVLCDFAEVINGKLYIQGGGVAQFPAGAPVPLALAVVWEVPWERGNQRQDIEFALLTEDGEPRLNDEGEPLVVKGTMEVGRPAGVRPGMRLSAPLAVRLPPMAYDPGGYRWELKVNGTLEAWTAFHVIES